jgi:hypothetical protein
MSAVMKKNVLIIISGFYLTYSTQSDRVKPYSIAVERYDIP